MKAEERVEILKNCSFLAGAGDDALGELARAAEVLPLAAGETVVSKGDVGNSMYFIASGQARVHDGEVELAQLLAGEVFGEMAVLDSDVRSASVTTETDSVLLCLEKEAFWASVSRSTEALKSIIAAVLQRERSIVSDITARAKQVMAFEKELEIGRRIQANFLPETVPETPNWELATYFEAAREVAGDFYDVFELKKGKYLALVIGDVCDKGVGAALFMTLFRSLIRASCQFGLRDEKLKSDEESGVHVRELLESSISTTNRYISTTHSKSSMFASVFFGVLDLESGSLDYINGGHESPVIFRTGGGCEILEVTGGVLGLFPFARHTIATAQVDPGDLLFAYTDGINEAKDESNDVFGDSRILEMEGADWQDGEEFLEEIFRRISAFRGEAAQSDDITMFALRNEGVEP